MEFTHLDICKTLRAKHEAVNCLSLALRDLESVTMNSKTAENCPHLTSLSLMARQFSLNIVWVPEHSKIQVCKECHFPSTLATIEDFRHAALYL